MILARQNNRDGTFLKGDSIHSVSIRGRASGYIGSAEIGYSAGLGSYGIDNLNLNIINGYRFKKCFSIGIGIGYRYYFHNELEQGSTQELITRYRIVPVFLDLKATLSDKKISPFIAVGGGYSFGGRGMFQISKVGFIFNAGTGLEFNISAKSALSASIKYELQKMDPHFYNYSGGDVREVNGLRYVTNEVTLGSFGINICFSF
jgi:hypothetical protein